MYNEKQIGQKIPERPQNPFRTPDQYFETLEDRIMAGIKHAEVTQTKKNKIVHLLKPVLGLVASFALIYLLVYYPINHLVPQRMVKTEQADSSNTGIPEAYSLSFSSVDETTLLNLIISDGSSNESKLSADEVVSYLATGNNDVDLYSELQN